MTIKAAVESTATTRAGYVGGRTRRPGANLRDSDQATRDKPVVLVRGCRPVALTLTGINADSTIEWRLEQLGGMLAIGNNLLSIGRSAATLLTNLKGLFVVVATQKFKAVKPPETAKWHVLFADVEMVRFSHMDNQGLDLDLDSKGNYVAASGGVAYEIHARINPIDGALAGWMDDIEVSTIQCWTEMGARARGCYSIGTNPPAFDLLEPLPDPSGIGPYNDGEEGHESFPFDRCVKVERQGAAITIATDDVPSSSFPARLDKGATKILERKDVTVPGRFLNLCKGIHGDTHFVIALAACSRQAPTTFVAVKLLRWRFSVRAEFKIADDGSFFKNGTPLVEAVHVSELTLSPPVDAREAGIEVYGPHATGEGDEDRDVALNEYTRQPHAPSPPPGR
jgi:hypothetical protein